MLSTNGRLLKGIHARWPSFRFSLIIAIGFFAGSLEFAPAQSFDSGSNGSDGALNITTTVTFDPKSFNPPLDPDGDNIFHFTTINIASGVTVKLSGKIFTGPVFWLASGNVQINGKIDLNGENGRDSTLIPSLRVLSVPGAGGYAGGVGGRYSSSEPSLHSPPQPGNGPAGGAVRPPPDPALNGGAGGFSGNEFLVPLVGGSGGGGGGGDSGDFGAGGGAGGGAILIASSVSIKFGGGSITADGGEGGVDSWRFNNCQAPAGSGGGGAGGAIRLVSAVIGGSGQAITAAPRGGQRCGAGAIGGYGRIRLEAFEQPQGIANFGGTPVSYGSPHGLFLPSGAPSSVRVKSVAGVLVSQSPTGSFEIPDVVINSNVAVIVEIEAKNVPIGTVVKLHVFSENAPDQSITFPPLVGNLQQSSATASVVFPVGFTRGFVRATWTQ